MTQQHLRHEKDCLNCGAVVEDRYCSHCGQENLEPKESFAHLIGHFFADITHFDSKLFMTLKDLVFRPGYLTREYAAGRRVRYLHPVRMYVFISAIFFLALYAGQVENAPAPAGMSTRPDTPQVLPPREESMALHMSGSGQVVIDIVENRYSTLSQYEAAQAKLPDSSKDHAVMRWILRNDIRLKQAHGGRSKLHLEVNVQHTIPKLMFVLLPLFALFISWFYPRKKFVYTQHAIFSIHYHSFFFLMMLLAVLADRINDSVWISVGFPAVVLLLAFIYLVAGLKRMYGQSLWLAFAKAVGITVLYTLVLILAFTTLMVTAFYRI